MWYIISIIVFKDLILSATKNVRIKAGVRQIKCANAKRDTWDNSVKRHFAFLHVCMTIRHPFDTNFISISIRSGMNGGNCTAPAVCSCPAGYQGRHCEGGKLQEKLFELLFRSWFCKNFRKSVVKDLADLANYFKKIHQDIRPLTHTIMSIIKNQPNFCLSIRCRRGKH